jgi:hypothetical protein
MPQELVEQQHDLFLSSPSTRGRGQSVVRRPETAETLLGAEFEVGAAVELIQPDGQWQNGWKVADVVPTKIGIRYRIENGGDYRAVGVDQIRGSFRGILKCGSTMPQKISSESPQKLGHGNI